MTFKNCLFIAIIFTLATTHCSLPSDSSLSDINGDLSSAREWTDESSLPKESEYDAVSCEDDRCFYRHKVTKVLFFIPNSLKKRISERTSKAARSSANRSSEVLRNTFLRLRKPSEYIDFWLKHPEVQAMAIIFTDPVNCIPCKQLEPLLNSFTQKYPMVQVVKFDLTTYYAGRPNHENSWWNTPEDILKWRQANGLPRTGIPAMVYFQSVESPGRPTYKDGLINYFKNVLKK